MLLVQVHTTVAIAMKGQQAAQKIPLQHMNLSVLRTTREVEAVMVVGIFPLEKA